MVDVHEHFYDDDPVRGHPDVKTRLRDVSYFFLGNGFIQAAVQIAPSGEGTSLGLLIMNPERLAKKREALTMHPETGLENTMVRVVSGKSILTPIAPMLEAGWFNEYGIPVVEVRWNTDSLQLAEYFYCPDLSLPWLIREVWIKNLSDSRAHIHLKTGCVQKILDQEVFLVPGEEKKYFFRYQLDNSGTQVLFDSVSEVRPSPEAIEYWKNKAQIFFGSSDLDHYFKASSFQLPSVISNTGKVDGSIWQYNREWVRDQAMMAIGLTLSGHCEIARKMLHRLLREFVTDEGDTIDSSERRERDDIELDQNGVLLYALKNYVMWTDDNEIIKENWMKIVSTAEFPLRKAFRHEPSGLLTNKREYWERHRAHGIEEGMELANQLFVSVGLSCAASLARFVSHETEALRWEKEAERIKNSMLNDSRYSLIDRKRFIKRRRADGSVQESINASPEARLPGEAPLSGDGAHLLNPDASIALPIAMGFISPDSAIALNTLANLEELWNQFWEGGGYGRYHASSEPDSPGAWPFPSLFIARAYMETEDFEKVWRILRWLNTTSGATSGSWFEFYGHRLAPPFPQVGIVPWTWAEMLIFLIHHIIGIQPNMNHLRIRPRMLPGIQEINASFPLRNSRLQLEIKGGQKENACGFRSNGTILESTEKEAILSYSEKDLLVDVFLP